MSEDGESKGFGSMTVEQIMSTEVHCFTPGMSVRDCIQLLLDNKMSGAPLVKEGGKTLIGDLGQKELIHFAAIGGLSDTLLSHISRITKVDKLIIATKDDSVKDIIIKFIKNPVRRIFVIDKSGQVLGILTRSQLLKLFMAQN